MLLQGQIQDYVRGGGGEEVVGKINCNCMLLHAGKICITTRKKICIDPYTFSHDYIVLVVIVHLLFHRSTSNDTLKILPESF